MNLVETLNTATSNAWALLFGGGLEPYTPAPSTVLSDEPHRLLRRYGDPETRVGTPVLMVPPLAAPATCFDLRPGQSLAEFLLDSGRTPYLLDYGTISYADRRLGFEEWFDDIIPGAIRQVSADNNGEPVDVVAWCLGGTMTLMTAAAHNDLPIRSIVTVATPIDYGKLPNLAPIRRFARLTGGFEGTLLSRLAGSIPSPVVQASFRATAIEREIKKPWFIASNLHQTEKLVQMEAIERFMGMMPAYPGRLYGQLWGRIMVRNDLAKGRLKLGDRTIDFSNIDVPVLAVAGTGDAITSVESARKIVEILSGAPTVQFEEVPGSHLGVLAGPAAKDTTWPHIDKFLAA
ncbi:alpha/beta hydrolase [Antrihabitans sp. YC2-6]|uniref:alpha/beta hydrolase n=1 Tax=Antrihabitans sp. YC2-6 TaxID=2799498 RepID=UPI0018F692AA|nr:alpha/beta hydrolase [Antrihabitans sp. YC2-6]MBJ8345083.1 alpha/beta hydrolase [Antrihabitans sp. YC2-6]